MSFRPLKELTEHDKGLIAEELKAVFRRHEEILFALLFGSLVNPPLAGKYGDMDIPTTIHIKSSLPWPVSVSDGRDKPDGFSSVPMRQVQ